MILQSNSTPPNQRVQRFLNAVDAVTAAMGRNIPPIVPIELLRSLPTGTFGRAWADHLAENHLQPFTTGSRRKQLHDGVHVLTGYGTDAIGEAEVQAFLLGAKFQLIQVALLLGLLRGVWQQSAQTELKQGAIRDRLWQAYQRGRSSCFNADTWQPEDLWEQPIKTVQARFGIAELIANVDPIGNAAQVAKIDSSC